MALWSMDDWQFLEKQVVKDPKGRQWTIALMDVLGQEGDPDIPNHLLEMQYESGRYFTLVYSSTGTVVSERGYTSQTAASAEYTRLLEEIIEGRLDPSQPVFRANLED